MQMGLKNPSPKHPYTALTPRLSETVNPASYRLILPVYELEPPISGQGYIRHP